MKKCSRCQAENFEDQKFCNLCGRELTQRISLDLVGTDPTSGKGDRPRTAAPAAESPPPTKSPAERLAYQHFLLAKEEVKRKNLDGAVREFQAALAACPGDPMIERLLQKPMDARDKARAQAQAARSARGGVQASRSGSGARPAVGGGRAAAALAEAPEAEWDQPLPGIPSRARGQPQPARTAPRVTAHAHHHEPSTLHRKGRADPSAGDGSVEGDTRPTGHTGRFLEVYSRTPTLSPAMMMDGRSDDGIKEIAVSVLMLAGLVAFGFLLLL
ncbi:MAG: hypothetical protein HY815_11320 [Candidatus Riflebacteria bacterium]|nr:hypothetical protein [Candidatus Riflebacteria bacterium]